MKKFFIALLVLSVAFFVFVFYLASQPPLIARVEVGNSVVVITNGNDAAWQDAEVFLNDTFDGAMLKVEGTWAAGESKELRLSEFKGQLNKQPFKSDFQTVSDVFINVRGFSMGMYKNRTQ